MHGCIPALIYKGCYSAICGQKDKFDGWTIVAGTKRCLISFSSLLDGESFGAQVLGHIDGALHLHDPNVDGSLHFRLELYDSENILLLLNIVTCSCRPALSTGI